MPVGVIKSIRTYTEVHREAQSYTEKLYIMSGSNFVDYIKIYCRSGKGGAGSAHFRREKFEPKGGPDGGDGGRGGHIILRGNDQMWTLLHLKYQRHIFAENGGAGGRQTSTGADGKDVIIQVPLGTIAKRNDTEEVLFEITVNGEEKILAKGGRGGQGNNHFKSSTNQTPRYAQPGEPAIEEEFILELKILADVGLVGFPNAGNQHFFQSFLQLNLRLQIMLSQLLFRILVL